MKQMSYKWFCERSQWDVILGINEITFSKNHVHLIVCNVKRKKYIFHLKLHTIFVLSTTQRHIFIDLTSSMIPITFVWCDHYMDFAAIKISS